MTSAHFLLLAIFIANLYPLDLFACDCPRAGTIAEEFSKSTVVALGRVNSISKNDLKGSGQQIVEVQSLEIFKGNATEPFFIEAAIGRDCKFWFEKTKTYLIFATGSSPYTVLTKECGRTQLKNKAGTDLAWLRRQTKSSKTTLPE